MEKQTKKQLLSIWTMGMAAFGGFIFGVALMVALTQPLIIHQPSNPYSMNVSACENNTIVQNCGIPTGQVCTVVNSTGTQAVLVCLDYWITPSGKVLVDSNTNVPSGIGGINGNI